MLMAVFIREVSQETRGLGWDMKYIRMEMCTLVTTRTTRSMDMAFSTGLTCQGAIQSTIKEAGGRDSLQGRASINAQMVSLEMIQVIFIMESSRTASSMGKELKSFSIAIPTQAFM
jgi:hypothetical protein